MSGEELKEPVSKAFEDYRNGDVLALSNSPLAHSSLTAPCFLEGEPITPALRGRAMGSVLRWAVDTLKPGGEHSWPAYQWRYHNILYGYHLYIPQAHEKHFTIEKLAEQMAIATQTFHNWRETAFKLVGQRLRMELSTPQAAQERQSYAFADRYASLSSDEQLLLRISAVFRLATPIKLLEQTAQEAQGANIQESIHNLVTNHLLISNEEHTEVLVHPQIRSDLLILLPWQERQQWHQATGSHYEQQQAYLEAAHHFRRAGAYEPAAQILITHYQAILNNNQVAELRDMVDEFQPAELPNNSWARLQIIAGQTAEFMADLDTALEKYRKALAAKEVRTKAEAYYRRAKLFELKNIDEALAHYNMAIDLLEESRPTDRMLLAQIYISSSWIFIEVRPDLDEAAATLRRAEALIDRPHLAAWADLHNGWAELFQRKEKLEDAIKYRFRAWLAAHELQDIERMIKFAHNLGVDYTYNSQYKNALKYLKISRTLAIQAQNRQYEASCNEQIGACYFWLAEYEKARHYYQMAYQAHLESGNRDWLTHSCYNLAEVYLELGDVVQARRYFDEGTSIAKELRNERMLGLFEKLEPKISLHERQRSLQMSLNERQRKGLEHVKQHGEIPNRTYRKVTGASEKKARNDLKDLVEKGVFKKVGKGRSTSYVLAE
ncbi:MAG: tetratricopeptide repeat protein [Ardenticatenaceae bacterium]